MPVWDGEDSDSEEEIEALQEILGHACDYFRAKASGDEMQAAREEVAFRTAYDDAPTWIRHQLPLIK